MNKLVAVFVVAIWAATAGPVSAMEWTTSAAPVDFRACNFRDGKTMADFDKVAAKFRDYAKNNDIAYSAWAAGLAPGPTVGPTASAWSGGSPAAGNWRRSSIR